MTPSWRILCPRLYNGFCAWWTLRALRGLALFNCQIWAGAALYTGAVEK